MATPFEEIQRRLRAQTGPSADNSFEAKRRLLFGTTDEPSAGELGAAARVSLDGTPEPNLEPDLSTAIGRGQREEEDIAYQEQLFSSLIANTTTQPKHRQRLQGLVDRLHTSKLGSVELTNRITTERSSASNFARGLGAGTVNFAVLGAADLAAAVPNIAGRVLGIKNFLGSEKLRDAIAETQAQQREMWNPEGKAGFAGTAIGAFLPSIATGGLAAAGAARGALLVNKVNPFSILNHQGMKALAHWPWAAAIVKKGFEPGATYFQRFSAQMIGSGAIDAVAYVDIMTSPELRTREEKITAMSLTALLSAGASGAAAIRSIRPTRVELEAAHKPPDPTVEASPDRIAEAEALARAATDNAQRVNRNKRMGKAARSAWELANPERMWKELTKAEKAAVVKKFTMLVSGPDLAQPPAPPAEIGSMSADQWNALTPEQRIEVAKTLAATPASEPVAAPATPAEVPAPAAVKPVAQPQRPTAPPKAAPTVKPVVAAKPANALDAQLAALKERVSKEGIPALKADLTQVESIFDLTMVAALRKVTVGDENIPVSKSEVETELVRRRDDIEEKLTRLKDNEDDPFQYGSPAQAKKDLAEVNGAIANIRDNIKEELAYTKKVAADRAESDKRRADVEASYQAERAKSITANTKAQAEYDAVKAFNATEAAARAARAAAKTKAGTEAGKGTDAGRIGVVPKGGRILNFGGSFDPSSIQSVESNLAQIKAALADPKTPMAVRAKLLADRKSLEQALTTLQQTPPPSQQTPELQQTSLGEPTLKLTTERVAAPKTSEPKIIGTGDFRGNIGASAVRSSDNRIFLGVNHTTAKELAIKHGVTGSLEDGLLRKVDDKYVFVNRAESQKAHTEGVEAPKPSEPKPSPTQAQFAVIMKETRERLSKMTDVELKDALARSTSAFGKSIDSEGYPPLGAMRLVQAIEHEIANRASGIGSPARHTEPKSREPKIIGPPPENEAGMSAFMTPDGTVYTGIMHGDALELAEAVGWKFEQLITGFLWPSTNKNNPKAYRFTAEKVPNRPARSREDIMESAGLDSPPPEAINARLAEMSEPEKDAFVHELVRLNGELTEQRNSAQRTSETDEMTGLGNGRAWKRALGTANQDPNVEIVMFDLMNLKAVNDLISSAEGDTYIVDAANAIRTGVAASDSPLRVFRHGSDRGDEFAAIVPKGKGAQIVADVVQILGTSSAGEFPTGIRGAVGATAAEADAAIRALKAGEKHAKFRPLTGIAAGKKQKAPKASFHGIPLKKPLDAMNENELEFVNGKLDDKFKVHDKDRKMSLEEGREYSAALLELKAADDARVVREAAERQVEDAGRRQKPPGVNDRPVVIDFEKGTIAVEPPVQPETPEFSAPASVVKKGNFVLDPLRGKQVAAPRFLMDVPTFRRLTSARPKTLTDVELTSIRDELNTRLLPMDPGSAKDSGYTEKLAVLNEEAARRNLGPPGITLNTTPQVVGGALGIWAYLMDPQDEDQRKLQNAMYALSAAAIVGPSVLRRLNKAKLDAIPDHQAKIRENVRSIEDGPLADRKGIYTRLSALFEGIARRDLPITQATKLLGKSSQTAGNNPGKMAEIFGLWRQVTDSWLGLAHGKGVGYYTNDGEFIKLDSPTLQEIAFIAKGDTRGTGELALARRELALRQREVPRSLGFDVETARRMFAGAAEHLHKGAEALMQYYRALAQTSVASGLLNKDLFTEFEADAFYVAVRRLFHSKPGTQPSLLSTRSVPKGATGPAQLFHKITGSKRPIQNPVEAAIDLTGRYMKAGELNRLATVFFDHILDGDPEVTRHIAKRVSKAQVPAIEGQAEKIKSIKKDLASMGHGITDEHALSIASAVSEESLNVTSDMVRLYRNGQMEVWQVSDPVARAFRSLQPYELEMVMEGAGLLTKPTQMAKVGITANPIFITRQAFRDIWQFYMNGTYSPPPSANIVTKIAAAPFGLAESAVSSVQGYLAQMFRTNVYKEFVSAGGGGESVASQGLRVVRGDIRESTSLLNRIKEPPTKNQFSQILKEVKLMKPRDVYSSIMGPIADAGRVGAYMKERGRGADVIEAIWRAKKAGANFNNRGSNTTIRALDRITLFLNPSIQGIDASRFAFQRDPTGYVIRGIAGIMIPSILLWMANKDDGEIDQLRRTPDGNRFWFTRLNGRVIKIAKPILEGQVFGSSAEAYMDQLYKDDPYAAQNFIESMENDAAFNLIPLIGVVPYTMTSGKIPGTGADLVPQSAQNLDIEHQARPNNTYLSRVISGATAPTLRKYGIVPGSAVGNTFTPAGLDFMVRTFLGTGGAEISEAFSTAIEYGKTGELPPVEEWAFVRGTLARYPTMNVAAVREFYNHAEQFESAINTVNFLANTDPDKLNLYMQQRQRDVMMGKMLIQQRSKIADLTKALRDIQNADSSIMPAADKKLYEREMLGLIIETAQSVNEAARQMLKEQQESKTGPLQFPDLRKLLPR